MFLRQSSAGQVVSQGQFLDATDGNTAMNALTINNINIKLRKGNSALLVNKSAGGAVNISNGVYQLTLDAADTDTAGILEIYIHVAGALATKSVYDVLPQASYDALIVNGLNNFDANVDAVANVTLVGTTTNNTDMRGTDNANLVTPATVAQFNARTIPSTNYATSASILALNNFDPFTDTVANVNLVNTTITNTDMVGTNNALKAANYTAPNNAGIASILVDTNDLQTNQGNWLTATGFATSADISALNNFNPLTDTVANVTLVGTTTLNTDMRGTNNAMLLSSYVAPNNSGITSILADTNELVLNQGNWSTATGFASSADIAALNNVSVNDILTTQMTESYALDGAAPSLAQCLFITMQNLSDYKYVGTTQTVTKLDGISTAATYTLDDAIDPTSKTRSS